jgi:GTPase involved in cell partitioning and DNA repair
VIQAELAQYQVDLSAKPQLVVISKSETVDAATLKRATAAIKKVAGKTPIFTISAQTHTGPARSPAGRRRARQGRPPQA